MIKAGQLNKMESLSKIHRIQKGLMGVRISKGSGTVTLTFVPQGFIEGLIAFFVGIILFSSTNGDK